MLLGPCTCACQLDVSPSSPLNRKELWMVQPNRRERRFQIRPQEVGLARPIPGDESAR